MSTYFAIFLLWLAPGLGVFLYLLWISKRRPRPTGEADASALPVQPPQQLEQQEPSAQKEAAKGG